MVNNMAHINVTCPDCGGRGKTVVKPCPDCNGKGFGVTRERIKFSIPLGCPNGYKIVERGKGHQYEKDRFGDLIIIVYSNDHPLYKRVNDKDLIIELPIPVHVSIIGGKLPIPTVHGEKVIDIPQGIRDGQRIVYRGIGLPVLNTKAFGDMYIIARLETPKEISDEMKEIFSKIEINESSYPIYTGFMKEVVK